MVLNMEFGAAVLPSTTLDEIFAPSERAAVIVVSALIEDRLKKAIQEKLAIPGDEEEEEDPLFDGGNAPIGTFAARTMVAVRFGIITPEFGGYLDRFRRARNKYVHRATGHEAVANQMLNDLTKDFFGITHPVEDKTFTVAYDCSLKESPIAQMILRQTPPRTFARRLLLMTIIAVLGKYPENTTGGISIRCKVISNEAVKFQLGMWHIKDY